MTATAPHLSLLVQVDPSGLVWEAEHGSRGECLGQRGRKKQLLVSLLPLLLDLNRPFEVTERRAEKCSVTEQKCLYVSVTDFPCTTLPL